MCVHVYHNHYKYFVGRLLWPAAHSYYFLTHWRYYFLTHSYYFLTVKGFTLRSMHTGPRFFCFASYLRIQSEGQMEVYIPCFINNPKAYLPIKVALHCMKLSKAKMTHWKHWVLYTSWKHRWVIVAVVEVEHGLLSSRVGVLRLAGTVGALSIYSCQLGCVCCGSCIEGQEGCILP